MALPAGIQTCEVTFGPFTTFLGQPISGSVSFVPSRSLLWVATGTPVMAKTEIVTLDSNGEGHIYLPYTDQDGFSDGSGNSIHNWTYRAVFNLQSGVPQVPPVTFQLPSGPAVIDLDLVTPATGVSEVIVDLPEVLSVNGQTGNVVISGGGGGGPHTHPASDIDNSTPVGRAVLTAADAAAARSAIGAGTSSLVVGTSSGQAAGATVVVTLSGAQTVSGVKTFTDAPVVPNNSWTIAKTSGLQAALDAKSDTGHSHTISGVTGLTSALDGKAPSSHSHTVAQITASGTRDSSTVLHGDGAWRAAEGTPGQVAGSSARFWGLYSSFGELPASGSGQVTGDFALFVSED